MKITFRLNDKEHASLIKYYQAIPRHQAGNVNRTIVAALDLAWLGTTEAIPPSTEVIAALEQLKRDFRAMLDAALAGLSVTRGTPELVEDDEAFVNGVMDALLMEE